MPTLYTADEILRLGLLRCLTTDKEMDRRKRSTNEEDFSAVYGPSPKVVAELWSLLQTTNNLEHRIHNACCIKDFFVALHWLRNYPTERKRKVELHISRMTARKWSWYYTRKLSALKDEIITLPEEWDTTFTMTVDGVHFLCNELNHPEYRIDTEAYSHKFGNAGLAYEIGISIFEQKVVWVNGPFKAGTSDKVIFEKHGLKDNIPAGKRALADKGYRKMEECVSYPNSLDTDDVRAFKEQALARHEIFNGRLKRYKILTNRFRSKHNTKYKPVVEEDQTEFVIDPDEDSEDEDDDEDGDGEEEGNDDEGEAVDEDEDQHLTDDEFKFKHDRHKACFGAAVVICQIEMTMGSTLFVV